MKQRTFTGKLVDVNCLTPDDIHIEDIAHSLANQCRFTGHTYPQWSVAAHSLLVCDLVEDPALKLTALLHDASEYLIGDMASPIKHLPEMAPFRELEDRVMAVIAKAFGLVFPFPEEIKLADVKAAISERVNFFPNRQRQHGEAADYRSLGQPNRKHCDPAIAKDAFLARYYMLLAPNPVPKPLRALRDYTRPIAF